METSNFKKLTVWQKANELALALYEISKVFQKKDSHLATSLIDCGVTMASKVALAGELWSMEQKIGHLEKANETTFTAISLLNLSERLEIINEETLTNLENQLIEISHAIFSWIKNCNRKLTEGQPTEQNSNLDT